MNDSWDEFWHFLCNRVAALTHGREDVLVHEVFQADRALRSLGVLEQMEALQRGVDERAAATGMDRAHPARRHAPDGPAVEGARGGREG